MNLELPENKIINNLNKKFLGKNHKKTSEMISLLVANNKTSIEQMKYYKDTPTSDVMKETDDQVYDKIYIVNNGIIKLLKFETIKKYISVICQKMKVEHLDVDKITKNVYPKLKTKNTINEVQDQIVMSASEMVTDHYDYPCIATWILINSLHKNTHDDYTKVVQQLRSNINKKGKHAPIVSSGFADFVEKYHREINQAICYERDYDISVFGFRTLEKAYLKKMVNGNIIERPQHMYMRVAIALHYRTGRLDRIFETYELLSKGYFTHATPTLFNAGTTHEQLSSCFLLGINDDMEAIGECWKDCAVISKYAGGIGINVTNIRVDGAYINSTQGQASGLRLLTVFNQIARYADQGGKRAGSIAIYIEPWHADVYFFLDLKKNTGAETERARDLFLALMVNDIFMERVENDGVWSLMCPAECPELLNKFGEEFTTIYKKYESEEKFIKQVPARDLWFKIMESQIETGVPYIVFKDAVNYKSNQINIGVVNGSNLCVSGDTMILTSKGYMNIKRMENKKVNVWNGEDFSEVTIKKTGINQDMIKIDFTNGSSLKCTPYHKFYITDANKNQNITKIEANQLKIGDKLIKTKYPIIKNGSNNFKYPYTHGLFCADGTYEKSKETPKQCNYNPIVGKKYCKRHINHFQDMDTSSMKDINKCHGISNIDHPKIDLYSDKQELYEFLDVSQCGNFDFKNNKLSVRLYHDIAEKFKVPINYDIDIKLRWLEGLLDGDGCLCINGTNKSLQISSINKKFLNKVKYMLHTMGCDPKVTLASTRDKSLLPDGKGGQKMYDRKIIYRIIINSNDLHNLVKLGLNPKRLNLGKIEKPQRCASQFVKIKKITKLNKKEDTYCFTEPKRNMGIFNGIIAGNCAEIVEVSSADEYAVCNLASICLPKYIKYVNGKPEFDYKELYRVARVAARNLNNVIDINFYPVDKTRVTNLKHRPIGIGVQGLADVFAMFKTPFDSELARDINKKIFETIYYGALTESMTIAKESGHYQSFRGSPLSQGKFQFDLWGLDRNQLSGMWDWNGLMEEILIHGVANSLVTTCMPTASTSQIMGNNECIEPYTENIYTRTTLAGEYYIINKHLMKDLMELGLWNSDMVDLIKYFEGSIANIPGIPDDIKQIYRTVWEIPQKSIIDMAADRGPFVDQTQSMNIFIAKANFVKLNSCLFRAWKRGLKTGIYYLRSKAASEANKFGIDIDKITELNSKYNIISLEQEMTDAMPIQESNIIPSSYEQPIKSCPYRPKHLRGDGKCEPCGS
ncbi:putative ribonucleoside di phosphate reductase alpha subunit [Tupanvirus deep ocean]|uniref:Ribonucleoside di phosphate reductase alpha subunit n=2 Tax=Tupanvirus TaxID=2094720 RepID=A0AC62A7V9_9VIRU|nr:putative ribonucleoside di phosphate reductase alpha subunit [Tupanvirus deep ocean]QKU33812.1 putative ribonucleoside di phosphate reductase alpha subunit [Tupanvirus deep ocean]